MRSMQWLLALVLCQACTAQTSGSLTSDGANEAASSCGATCSTGCCAAGSCQGGNEDNACGKNGNPCIQCDIAYHCENGLCVPGSSRCNASNCSDGCCTANGECLRPSNGEHCGLNGADCAACITEATCTNGSCMGSCSESSCSTGCCANTGACIQTPTDESCGKGGKACTKCDPATQTCDNGTCATKAQPVECTAATCADGCCDGTTCVLFASQTDGKCGKNAAACAPCDTSTQSCQSGTCAPKTAQCNSSNCADGCCDGTTCVLFASQTDGKCGKNAAACAPCDTSTQSCQSGACAAKPPTCNSSNCSGGCCDGTTCVLFANQNGGKCGNSGQACHGCDDGNPCTDDNCSSGSCTFPARSSCPGGQCHNGSCCTGCWDGGSCRGGYEVTACGSFGQGCSNCNSLINTECQRINCASGMCGGQYNLSDGTSCTGGKCSGGSCKTCLDDCTHDPSSAAACCSGQTCSCSGYTVCKPAGMTCGGGTGACVSC